MNPLVIKIGYFYGPFNSKTAEGNLDILVDTYYLLALIST